MPFTTEQLSYAGKAAIDYFQKNDPIDQVNVARPLLKMLMEKKREYAGGLQYVVEQLRTSNDSNFQSYFGDSQVSYNRKRTLDQAKFSWGSFHDGFGLNEDELAQNGISMTDDKNSVPTDAEKVQLTNLLQENTETLKLGFQEGFDLMLHRDGTQSATDIAGLDLLVSTTPTTSTLIGTINQNTNTFWRNNVSLDIAEADLLDEMEIQWRECTRYGGSAPDFILVGDDFLDAYRRASGQTINRQIHSAGNEKGGVSLDGSVSKVYFKGVELVWDPVFDVLDSLDAPAQSWSKRCYFLNSKFMSLRPIKGHWMVSRKPPRVYDRYTHFWALTAKAAMTISKRNAMSVLTID
jgi:hypothetical protein